MAERARYIIPSERALLLSLIDDKKAVLFDKSHDFRTIKKKREAWEQVTESFNLEGLGPPRSQQQLKKIWENSKGKAKKEHASFRREPMRTGGGHPPKPEDEETVKILSIIEDDLFDLGNDLDSDAKTSAELLPVIFTDSNGHGITIEEAHTPLSIKGTSTPGVCKEAPSQIQQLVVKETETPSSSRVHCSIKLMEQQKDPEGTPAKVTPNCAPVASSGANVVSKKKKHRRTGKFSQQACYEESLSLQRKEHEITMKIKEAQLLEAQLGIQLKEAQLREAQLGIQLKEAQLREAQLGIQLKEEQLKELKTKVVATCAQIDAYENLAAAATSSIYRGEELSSTTEKSKNVNSDSHLAETSENPHENNHSGKFRVKEEVDYIVKEEHDIIDEENKDLGVGEMLIKGDVDLHEMSCDAEENFHYELNGVVKEEHDID